MHRGCKPTQGQYCHDQHHDLEIADRTLGQQGEEGEKDRHDQNQGGSGAAQGIGQRAPHQKIRGPNQQRRHCKAASAKSPGQDDQQQREHFGQDISDRAMALENAGETGDPGDQQWEAAQQDRDDAGAPHGKIVERE